MAKKGFRIPQFVPGADALTADLQCCARMPKPRPSGWPVLTDLEGWRVIDDWPKRVPVTEREVDVFEAWFGDVLDEMFGPA